MVDIHDDKNAISEAAPHYHGHRERLRARFREAGRRRGERLVELVLFRAIPQRDVKPLAKQLIAEFGSFAEVIAAAPARLREVKGIGDTGVTELSGRCCPHGQACSITAARRWRFPTRSSCGCCSSTSVIS